jgi:long-subunit acyl-CoA synthetase (AMP-forming)
MHLSGAYVGYAIAFLPDPLQAAAALPAVKPTVFPSVPAVYEKIHTGGRGEVRRRDGREAEADRLGARRRPPGQRSAPRREAGAARLLVQHRSRTGSCTRR